MGRRQSDGDRSYSSAPRSGYEDTRRHSPRIRCILQRGKSPVPIHNPDSVPFFLNSSLRVRRLRDMNSTGRNPSSVLTTTNSERSSRNTIRTLCSSFTKVSHRMSGTQISSAKYEAASKCYPTHWHRLNEEPGWCVRSNITVENFL